MSRGQRSRTPDEFPRMKHRAAGRQMRNRERILKDFLARSSSAVSTFDAMARLVEQFVTEVAQPIIDRVREAFLGTAQRSDYALVPAPPAPSSLDRQRELYEQWRKQHPEDGLAARPIERLS